MSPARSSHSPDTAGATVQAFLQDPERTVQEALTTARAAVDRCVNDATAYTQLYPQKALLWSLGAGFVLRTLPTGRMLGGVLRLALTLAKPAGLAYGAAKLWQKFQASPSVRRKLPD